MCVCVPHWHCVLDQYPFLNPAPPVHMLQVVARHRLVCPGAKGGGASSPFDVLELCGDRLLLKLPLRRFEVYDVSHCKGGGVGPVVGRCSRGQGGS